MALPTGGSASAIDRSACQERSRTGVAADAAAPILLYPLQVPSAAGAAHATRDTRRATDRVASRALRVARQERSDPVTFLVSAFLKARYASAPDSETRP